MSHGPCSIAHCSVVRGAQWSVVLSGPWCSVVRGAQWSVVLSGPRCSVVRGAQWSVVLSGPWCSVVRGAQWSVVLSGPRCSVVRGAQWSVVLSGPWSVVLSGPWCCGPWCSVVHGAQWSMVLSALLFSATFKRRIERLCRDILRDPIRVIQGDIGEVRGMGEGGWGLGGRRVGTDHTLTARSVCTLALGRLTGEFVLVVYE